MGYFITTFKGLTYQSVLRFSIRIIGLLKFAIIARILGPVEFGVFGIASLVLSLLETITDTGTSIFLIQEKNGLEKYLNSAFIVSVMRGFVIASMILLLGPIIKVFFNIQNITQVFTLASLVAIFRGFINPAVVKFEKDIRFDKELIYRLFLYSIDAFFALYFTNRFKIAEGIILGMLAGVFAEILISWIFISPKAKILLDPAKIKYVISRGKWVTLTGIFNYLFHNLDDIVVGKLLGLQSLGIYQLSYRISSLPIYETGEVFGRVTLPVYSKLSGDKIRLKEVFLQITLVISVLSIAAGVTLLVFAKDIVTIFFGSKWIEAVNIIRILAIFSVLRSISGSVTPLFYALKKQEYAMRFILVGLMVLLVTIVPLINLFGLSGAGYATIVATVFTFPIIGVYIKKELLSKDK